MAADLKDPEYWRFRAEEVLSIAGSLEHQETKKSCSGSQTIYERIAQMVERQREREKK
jgi:hypothetical protein